MSKDTGDYKQLIEHKGDDQDDDERLRRALHNQPQADVNDFLSLFRPPQPGRSVGDQMGVSNRVRVPPPPVVQDEFDDEYHIQPRQRPAADDDWDMDFDAGDMLIDGGSPVRRRDRNGRDRSSIPRAQRPRRVGQLESQTFRVRLNQALGVDELDRLESDIDDALYEAERAMHIRRGDQVSIQISGMDTDGLEFSATLSFRTWSDIDADALTDLIQRTLDSNRELTGEIEIEVTVNHNARFQLAAGGDERSVFTLMVRACRSIVLINPEEDKINQKKNCLQQCVMIGLLDLFRRREINRPEWLAFSGNTYEYPYSSVTGKKEVRFVIRKQYTEKLLECLPTYRTDEEFILSVEDKFKVQVVLYDVSSALRVVWPRQTPLHSRVIPLIHGLVYPSLHEEGTFGHVDFVINPSSLPRLLKLNNGKTHFVRVSKRHLEVTECLHCYELYTRKYACPNEWCGKVRKQNCPDREVYCRFCHVCNAFCNGCHTQDCGLHEYVEDRDAFTEASERRCFHCAAVLYSRKCEELHQTVCRSMSRRKCTSCGKMDHGNRPCNEVHCFLCGEGYVRDSETFNHECFVKPEKPKPECKKIMVYDFECVQDEEGIHIPYLCTAWLIPTDDPITKAWIAQVHQVYGRFVKIVNGKTVFVFWGLAANMMATETNVNHFFNMLVDPIMEGMTCFAHNAKSYDSVLVKQFMAKKHRQYSEDIHRGKKLLCMTFSKLNIRFTDSTCFIPSALRNLSADFGIEEVHKGFFPHSLMTHGFLKGLVGNYRIPTPSRELFEPSYSAGKRGEAERREFEEFWEEQSKHERWDLRAEAIKYCISDTLLLGECLIAFRQNFQDIVRSFTDIEFDPLAYVTLPSSMMSLFLSAKLEEKTIGVVDRGMILLKREAYALFLRRSEELNLPFDLESDTVAVFNNGPQNSRLVIYADCYMTGCGKCYRPFQVNERVYGTMEDAAREFKHCIGRWRVRYPFYFCEVVYSHERGPIEPRFEPLLPLDPREAYKGGKVEVYKMVHQQPLQMCDFVSEYPTTLLGSSADPLTPPEREEEDVLDWTFPVGQPLIRDNVPVDEYDSEWCGIIKCTVVPPQHLYAPFLSYRVYRNNTYEVIYGNCRSCMEARCWPCNHLVDVDRQFTGTWTCAEITHALSLGYKLKSIREVWIYETTSTRMFRDFIVPFMVEKILSKRKGLVDNDGNLTDVGTQTVDYIYKLNKRSVLAKDFRNAPARRTVAKLALNSFTGKWGEIEIHRTCRIYDQHSLPEAWKLFADPGVYVRAARVVDEKEQIVMLEHETKKLSTRVGRRKSDVIVAHITAYGRVMLSRLEQALGEYLIYEDTDSAFHSKLPRPVYRHGFRTGDLELELAHAIFWVSLGRKWYAYVNAEGSTVAKLKGFTLKAKAAGEANSKRMLQHLQRVAEALKESNGAVLDKVVQQSVDETAITVEQMQFRTEVGERLDEYVKRTVHLTKKSRLLYDRLKRYVPLHRLADRVEFLNSYPFGYVGETNFGDVKEEAQPALVGDVLQTEGATLREQLIQLAQSLVPI